MPQPLIQALGSKLNPHPQFAMKYARATLFFSVIAIFVATSLVTLLGVIGWITIDSQYLKVLFGALIIELVAAVIGLFKATDWFGGPGTLPTYSLIEGNWWQLIRHGRTNAVSFVQITYSEEQQQVIIEGDAYTAKGEPYARWWSVGAALNAATLELRYFWKGDEEKTDGDFAGVGFFRFNLSAGSDHPDRAVGWYTAGNIDQLALTGKPKLELRRASKSHGKTMVSNTTTREEKGTVAAQVYADWQKAYSGSQSEVDNEAESQTA